jgi:hypothetical protein
MWRQRAPEESTEENMHMGFLDSVVGQYFRDEKAGRVVAFPVDRRIRGYVVRSESEELKIRAFLKTRLRYRASPQGKNGFFLLLG